MGKWIIAIVIVCLATSLLGTECRAQQYVNDEKWRYRLVPYIWFSGVDGDVAMRGVSASVDASFSDLAENLDFAFQIHFEAQKDKWGYFIDPTYVNLSSRATGPDEVGADVDFTQWLVEFGGVRNLCRKSADAEGRTSTFDLLFGGRYWNLDNDLTIGDLPTVSAGDDWVDPIIGFRYTKDLSRLWAISVRSDIGGFGVGSDFTWNLVLLAGYRTSGGGQLLFGYRILDVDREKGSGADFFKFDVTYSGPMLGYSFNF